MAIAPFKFLDGTSLTTAEQQTELVYVGYFGRAGDPSGVTFWDGNLTAGATIHDVAANFSKQAEALALYPFLAFPTLDSAVFRASFINQIYTDFFNRLADAAGLAYWSAQLGGYQTDLVNGVKGPGGLSAADFFALRVGDFILQVAAGSQGSDITSIQSKVAGAAFLTDEFAAHNVPFNATAALFAHTDIAQIHDAATLATAEAFAHAFAINPPTQTTFTLTIGQDNIHGTGLDTFNAPLAGVFGDQETLTNLDSLVETGDPRFFPSVLNASFNGTHTALGVTIDGIGKWVLNQTSTELVEIHGGPGNIIRGLTNLTYNDNGEGGSLEVGEVLFPILVGTVAAGFSGNWNGFVLNVLNAEGGHHHHVDLAMEAGGFTGTDTIFVTANIVGNNGDNDLDNSYGIAAGSPTIGFQTWDVTSLGRTVGTVNDIALGADGNSTATKLIGHDDGSTTIVFASSASGSGAGDWANLATVDLSATTGDWTITGGQTDPGDNGDGLLAANHTALRSITGGSGTNLFDLSAFDGDTTKLSVNGGTGGHNTVELSNDIATEGTKFAQWTGVANLGIIDDGSLGGTVDMNIFLGTTTVNLLNEDSQGDGPGPAPRPEADDPDQTADFLFLNGPNAFTINANALDQNGHDFAVIGVGGANSTLHVNYSEVENSSGNFFSQNYDNVFIKLTDNGDHPGQVDLYSTHLTFVANAGDAEVATITNDPFTSVEIGTEDVTLEDAGSFVGFDTITLLGGTLLHPTTGTLNIVSHGLETETEIGVTNAEVIHATGGGEFFMSGPGDHFGPTPVPESGVNPYPVGVTVTADGGDSLLQGVLGPVVENPIFDPDLGVTVNNDWSGITGNDTLVDLQGGTDFFGLGGSDHIIMGQLFDFGGSGTFHANTVHFGEFSVDGDIDTQVISDNFDSVYQGFWGVPNFAGTPGENPNDFSRDDLPETGTSFSNTVIDGFNAGTDGIHPHDTLEFNVDAWADGATGPDVGDAHVGALSTGDSGPVALGDANEQIVDQGATLNSDTSLVLYTSNLGPIANAAALQALLTEDGIGNIFMAGSGIDAGDSFHMLFAYANTTGGVNIADVDLWNGNSSGTEDNTAELANGTSGGVHVSDMVTLTGMSFTDFALEDNLVQFVKI